MYEETEVNYGGWSECTPGFMLKVSMTLAMLWTNLLVGKGKWQKVLELWQRLKDYPFILGKSRIPSDKCLMNQSPGKSPSLIPSRTTYIQFYCI